MVSKQMVRNADDFGLNKQVNNAILNDYSNNLIDCASLMVTTKGFKEAVKLTYKNNIDTGLHLTLTTPWITYRVFIINWILGNIKSEWVYEKWDYQIKEYLATGLKLDRIDSHHGVHFYPVCWNPLMILMKKYKITYVRNPPRKFCWFNFNLKLWLGKNKSWLFYHINKLPEGIKSLPYKENICHPK